VQSCLGKSRPHAEALANKHQRPFRYLPSSAVWQRRMARQIQQEEGIKDGLVCVLSCVEPWCQTYAVQRDRKSKTIHVVAGSAEVPAPLFLLWSIANSALIPYGCRPGCVHDPGVLETVGSIWRGAWIARA